jgi:hypothetical protein
VRSVIFFSINVQAVCDLKIRNIVARWPGSVYDSSIFNDSSLCAQLENGRYEDGFLLGDSGYACRSFILTPLLNPRTPAEEAYNNSHRAQEIQLKGVLACSSDDFRALLLAYALKWTQLLQLL